MAKKKKEEQAQEVTFQTAIEKLQSEFEQVSYMGKVVINNCLLPQLKTNDHFEERILLPNKSVKDMIVKITNWVRSSKNHAPSHNIIFSLAIHYFEEDDPQYIEELLQEDPLEFGNVTKEFNTPMIKMITGTIIKETIKEVVKSEAPKNQSKKNKPKKSIPAKVSKTVQDSMKDIGQISLFED
jgi:hypothetical protein